jgi:hypothetical protein
MFCYSRRKMRRKMRTREFYIWENGMKDDVE